MADSALIDGILAGDLRSLARAATLLENGSEGSAEIRTAIQSRAGHARVIGITGPPGAGKSTLCDALTRELRAQSKTVAIIAVDPSSPVSGGALLGDRIRMQQHSGDAGVFIRSMASRGIPGGVARTTRDLVALFNASGRDVVIIETVGVGQSEIDVVSIAQITAAVLAPGAGDDVQAMKAGLMEVASLFVVNKSDLPGADKLAQELRSQLDLAGRQSAVVKASASSGEGIGELSETLMTLPVAPHLAIPEGAVIDHLGIAVRSLDDALRFYRDQLGLAVSARETVAIEKVDVALLPVGDSRIELLEASSPDSVIARFVEKHGPGIHHIALKVPDLAASVEKLKASGARLLNDPRPGAGGHIYVFVHPASTGGVLLELIQQ